MNLEKQQNAPDLEQRALPEEISQERQEAAEHEKGDTFPIYERFKLELAAASELLDKRYIKPIKGPKEHPSDKDADVNLAETIKVLESYSDAFAATKQKEEAVISRLKLPETEAMEERMKEQIRFTEQALRERNLLPDDYDKKKSAVADPSVGFDPEGAGGDFTPDKENPRIGLGGKTMRLFAPRIQEVAKKSNVDISDEEAVDMATTFFTGHEYGHYLNFVENTASADPDNERDEWLERTDKTRDDLSWITDEWERRPAFHEWICQSIGDQVLQSALEKKGLAPEVASQIKDLFTDDPADIVGSYRKLATWAETHDLPTYKVINAIWSTARELREAGREDLAEKLGGSFHFVGYCLKPLKKSELEYILKGKKSEA